MGANCNRTLDFDDCFICLLGMSNHSFLSLSHFCVVFDQDLTKYQISVSADGKRC